MRRVVAGGMAFAFAAIGSIGLAAPAGAEEEGEVEWDLTALDWDGSETGGEVVIDHEPLDGQLSDEAVGPGAEVSVSAECDLQRLSDPVHPHEVRWALVEAGTFPGWEGLPEGLTFDAVQSGTVEVPGPPLEDEDGESLTREEVEDLIEEGDFDWEATFTAPEEAGDYEFVAICSPVNLAEYPHCNIGTYGPADLSLEVDEDIPVEEPEDEPEEEEEDVPEEDVEDEVETPTPTPVVGEPDLTG